MKLTLVSALVIALTACRQASPQGTNPAPAITAVSLSGEYATAVTLASDACGGSRVMSFPTAVTHEAGASAITMLHAGSTYRGTVQPDGRFAMRPDTMRIEATIYVVTISGQFSARAFEAMATVDRVDAAHPSGCRYAARWLGTL